MNRPGRAALHALAWAAATLLVLWWTLLPFRHDWTAAAVARAVADIQWVPFRERGRAPLWSDVAGNLALFVPFGFAAWRFWEGRTDRLWRVLGSALVLSLCVEALQLTIPARRTSATDLVTDGLGALAGAGAGRLWETRLRAACHRWFGQLAAGHPGPVLVAVFTGCLALWAVIPGAGTHRDLWTQTQVLTSSFRRFPGWTQWAAQAIHPAAVGLCYGALASRSSGGGRAGAVLSGWLGAAVVGISLEILQVAAPTRRPDVWQAAAVAAGALPGALAGAWGRLPTTLAAATAGLVALTSTPAGGGPVAASRTALLLGAALTGAAALYDRNPGRAAGPQPRSTR